MSTTITTDGAYRKKILFVCALNRNRSFTAENLFKDSQLYDVKSRGVAEGARIRLTARDIAWADLIFVMEKKHKDRIAEDFGSAIAGKQIECLFIKDIYSPMERRLTAALRRKLAPFLPLPRFRITGTHVVNDR